MKRKRKIGFDPEVAAKISKTNAASDVDDDPEKGFESETSTPVKPKTKDGNGKTAKKKNKQHKIKKPADPSSESESEDEKAGKSKPKRQPSPVSEQKVEPVAAQELYQRRRSTPATSTDRTYCSPRVFASPQFSYWNQSTPKPLYRNHQLMGDSQFVRFSKQILQERAGDNRQIGYCISGQTIEDLYNLLARKVFPIHEYVMILIGTNNFVRRHPCSEMIQNYGKILELLIPRTKRIVLLTVPPVHKMSDSIQHWKVSEEFNKFILAQHNGEQVFVLDIGKHLTGYSGPTTSREYYEETFNGIRQDLIHLNRKGFLMLKFLLDLHYFGIKNY